MIRSIRARGKSSLGHTFLRLVKSTHILYFSFPFLTSTRLASHSVCMAPQITFASSSFCTSSWAASFLSVDIFQTFCLCGFFLGSTRRWCSMRSWLTSCRSKGLHVKTSLYSRRRATKAPSGPGRRSFVMRIVHLGVSSHMGTSLTSFVGHAFWTKRLVEESSREQFVDLPLPRDHVEVDQSKTPSGR